MRIRIKNHVSPATVAEAYDQALACFASTHEKFTFSNVNMYFQAIDEDGNELDVCDKNGNSLVVVLGQTNLPLSVRLKNQERCLLLTRQEIDMRLGDIPRDSSGLIPDGPNLYWATSSLSVNTQWEHRQLELENQAYIQMAELTTTLMLVNEPEILVESLNDTISHFWGSMNPLIELGASAGQPRPAPYFSIMDNALWLTDPTWVGPQKVSNPVARVLSSNDAGSVVEPLFWRHETWLKVTAVFADLIPLWSSFLKEKQERMAAIEREHQAAREAKRVHDLRAKEAYLAARHAEELQENADIAATAKLINETPNEFVLALNEAIQLAWSESPLPLYVSGPLKGSPPPLPYFANIEGSLFLVSAAWKKPRRMKNPMHTVWTHDAWAKAMTGIRNVLDKMSSPNRN